MKAGEGPFDDLVGQYSVAPRWRGAGREARLNGNVPYSLSWALSVPRSGPARTSVSGTWRYDSKSPCSADAPSVLDSVPSIAFSGFGFHRAGHGGERRFTLFALRPSFAGTDTTSAPSGTGSRRGRVGRPHIDPEIAKLVRSMALANPLWGAPRIHGELLKLGLDISQRTVGRLMPRRAKPPSQTWRTFLQNHVADRGEFRRRVKSIGIAEVLTTPRSPWQNPFAERVIGTIRRELLDESVIDGASSPRAVDRCRVNSFGSSFGQGQASRWRSSSALVHSGLEP